VRRAAAISICILLAHAAPVWGGPGLPPSSPRRAVPPGAPHLLPPVDGAIAARFRAPASDWGPGHRGIDYTAPEGSWVRAAADGDVTFAGAVGAIRAVSIAHAAGISTTYTSLGDIVVAAGDRVAAGTWIGTAGRAHPGGGGGLHFGVKSGGVYVDPERFLGPVDVAGAVYLVPDHPVAEARFPYERPPLADGSRDCVRSAAAPGSAPPTGNLAVVVAGFNSDVDAPVAALPRRLGYRAADVYRFSYRGFDGPRLFTPYARRDTYGSLSAQALRFAHLLRRLGRAHPGRGVDVFAHSQGGLIVREALARLVDEWEPSTARVEHVVTFATPHEGTDLAAARDLLDGGTFTRLGLKATRATGLADPYAPAVDEMRPGSEHLEAIASSDVTLGTRGLALVMPHDLVVPANRALWRTETSRTVRPRRAFGHSAIVASPEADALAYAFLRGASPCGDTGAASAGRLVGLGQRAAAAMARGVEEVAKRALSRTPVGRIVLEVAEIAAGATR
jgi:hypothetical protein